MIRKDEGFGMKGTKGSREPYCVNRTDADLLDCPKEKQQTKCSSKICIIKPSLKEVYFNESGWKI